MASHKKTLSLRDLPSVRQLRAFSVLYETGNVSAAAESLALTQPAVTVLLRELEAKLGVRLFERGSRGLQRTDAAVEAMAYAQRVLGDLNDLRSSMQAVASCSQGVLRIAATSTIAQSIVPRLIFRFTQRHPGVRVILDDCSPYEFSERIATERVHIGLGTLETPTPGLVEKVFQHDFLHALGVPSYFPGSGRNVTWKQLVSQPIIAVKSGYGVRRSIDQATAAAGVQLNLAYEVSLMSTALAMAEQGLGVALVPGSLGSGAERNQLESRRIIRPSVPRNLSAVHLGSRPLAPAAQAFVDLLISTPLGIRPAKSS